MCDYRNIVDVTWIKGDIPVYWCQVWEAIQGHIIPQVMSDTWKREKNVIQSRKSLYTYAFFNFYLSATKVRYRPIKCTVFGEYLAWD